MKRDNAFLLSAAALAGAYLLTRRQDAFDFRSKVVLISGGSRGLGLVLARELADLGAKVAIAARSEIDLRKARTELEKRGAEVLAYQCDITDRAAVRSLVKMVRAAWSRIDVLMNVAGIIQVGPMEDMQREDYQRALDTHFWGPYNLVEAVLPHMKKQKSGRIVNVSSIGGRIAIPHLLPYSVSKFALAGFSDGLREELAKDGIFVTTVCPGLMRTGSPRNALFKGNVKKEYAWFKTSDSVPVISMNAERAANKIIDACRRGLAETQLNLVAETAVRTRSLLPGMSSLLLSGINRILPASTGDRNTLKRGYEAKSFWSETPLAFLTNRAARANNEMYHKAG